ncbi:hypothetical protein P168DRAFT_306878 [Aspergillus campestris IBT 28561]|uniref:Histone chaperone domain-containing protein n=1 Tax=Aspergillus campestris (strain IBT 28561) TaxID=1392248 RepID=A0A2I1CVY6_ASPC2|nr:uncharacterized protein P168DRAFT_306878 [Aspergillus campestris IBT 28561]PKY01781.1 hypothetical protein P168DRAFT_306878 [Aspergillus campestris IBT 28561]
MSHRIDREAEDFYESQNDPSPVSSRFADDTYTGEPRQALKDRIPVQRDEDIEEDPMQPPFSNTDAQLALDEDEAIQGSNILSGDPLRHAKPQSSTKYSEGPDEDELPEEVLYARY